MARYATLVVFINRISQVELQQVDVNFDAKKIPVITKKGFAGVTPGAKVITMSFKSALPIAGPEFDPIEAAQSDKEYTVEVPYGAKTVFSVGEFMDGSLSGGAEQNTEIGFNFMGTYPKPK